MTDSRNKEPLRDESTSSESEEEIRPTLRRSTSPSSVRSLPVTKPHTKGSKIEKKSSHSTKSSITKNLLQNITKASSTSGTRPLTPTPAFEPRTSTPPTMTSMSTEMAKGLIKIDHYQGDRTSLEPFLALCELSFVLVSQAFDSDVKKVMFTGAHLKGGPLQWFSPILSDYLQNRNEAREETRQLFGSFSLFSQALRDMYGGGNPKRDAQYKIQRLRQGNAPASQYAGKFMQYAHLTGLNDEGLALQFYQGLSDAVKDELSRVERPATLHDMRIRAIDLDQRIQERKREKQGFKSTWSPNVSRQRDTRHSDPMDLDALHIRKRQGKLSDKDRKFRLANNLCLYCGKEGHRAKDCLASKNKKPNFSKKLRALYEKTTNTMDKDDYDQGLQLLNDYTIEDDSNSGITFSLLHEGRCEHGCSDHDESTEEEEESNSESSEEENEYVPGPRDLPPYPLINPWTWQILYPTWKLITPKKIDGLWNFTIENREGPEHAAWRRLVVQRFNSVWLAFSTIVNLSENFRAATMGRESEQPVRSRSPYPAFATYQAIRGMGRRG